MIRVGICSDTHFGQNPYGWTEEIDEVVPRLAKHARDCDAWIWAGDIGEGSVSLDTIRHALEAFRSKASCVCVALPGNHDISVPADLHEKLTTPDFLHRDWDALLRECGWTNLENEIVELGLAALVGSLGPLSTHLPIPGVGDYLEANHSYGLDTAKEGARKLEVRLLSEFRTRLKRAKAEQILVAMHIPPVGPVGEEERAGWLEVIAETPGVAAVVHGDTHRNPRFPERRVRGIPIVPTWSSPPWQHTSLIAELSPPMPPRFWRWELRAPEPIELHIP